jgi:hypothetical protein
MSAIAWIAIILSSFVLWECVGAAGDKTGRWLYRAYKKRKNL